MNYEHKNAEWRFVNNWVNAAMSRMAAEKLQDKNPVDILRTLAGAGKVVWEELYPEPEAPLPAASPQRSFRVPLANTRDPGGASEHWDGQAYWKLDHGSDPDLAALAVMRSGQFPDWWEVATGTGGGKVTVQGKLLSKMVWGELAVEADPSNRDRDTAWSALRWMAGFEPKDNRNRLARQRAQTVMIYVKQIRDSAYQEVAPEDTPF